MRTVAIVVLLLSACHRDLRYLGNTKPPLTQRLVYANAAEPATLDPDLVAMGQDVNIQQCLFEGLVVNNPLTSQPIAGMATHYEVSADGKEYTFYLRGHPHPKGTRLTDIGALPPEFSHGVHAPPDSTPARWSDLQRSLASAAACALRQGPPPPKPNRRVIRHGATRSPRLRTEGR